MLKDLRVYTFPHINSDKWQNSCYKKFVDQTVQDISMKTRFGISKEMHSC